MNTDIRLSVGFFDHPKTIKLERRLGFAAVKSLQILWLWGAQNRPDGNLAGLDPEDIEIAARWGGDTMVFFNTLLTLGWIDENQGSYFLHDWQEHNSWQAGASVRSEKARKASAARWGNAQACSEQCSSNAKSCSELCSSNAKSCSELCPSPLLSSPDLNINAQVNLTTTGKLEPAREPEASSGVSSDFSDTVISEPLDAPGLEFQELRTFYDEHGRAEAPLTGFIEYKQLRASRQWPGWGRITEAIDNHEQADPDGWKTFAPGLAKFLREHWWDKKPKARASPPGRQNGKATIAETMDKNAAISRKILEEYANAGHI